MIGTRNRYPFTAAQWEEFEQQALIYKYMLAGVPVPSHLLYSLKRNLYYSSTLVLPTRGWGGSYGENEMVGAAGAGCMSYGWGDRRIDPEPERCRRTDGKKWRCSKEAHPDSKYCERHMHRGRNKTNNSCSRKPVEFQFTSTTTTTTTTTAAAAISTSSINHSAKSPKLSSSSSYITPLTSSVIPTSLSHDHQNSLLYPSLHPHSSSSRPPTHPQHLMDTTLAYSQQDKDHRYQQEMRGLQRENERTLFSETAGSVRGLVHDPYYTTLKMDPSHHFNFHNLIEKSKQREEREHCYVLGTDIRSVPNNRSISRVEEMGTDQENLNKRFHHFFSDWPQPTPETGRDSATCLDDIVDDPSHKTISTSTQLSVSMPLSTQDFFRSKPTPYW